MFWPKFELYDDQEHLWSKDKLLGHTWLIYFYPKDDTPGCTKQACDLRDSLSYLQSLGIQVLGISPDNAQSHRQFKQKYQLSFPLLCDENHQLAKAMGVWRLKNTYGKQTWGIQRSSFLVDKQGQIIWEKRGVDAQQHLEEILQVLRSAKFSP